MKQEHITLRCEDGAEAVVFTKYTYKYDNSISYDICVEDSYIGGDYKGFFGRIKRAWKAFWDKPVVYTGIYCEDKDKMRKFLCDCLDLLDTVESDALVSSEEPTKCSISGACNTAIFGNGTVVHNEERENM